MGGYGSSGVPDIVACVGGRFVAIECKAGAGRLTELQKKNLQDIKQGGGVAIVVNDGELIESPAVLMHYDALAPFIDSLLATPRT